MVDQILEVLGAEAILYFSFMLEVSSVRSSRANRPGLWWLSRQSFITPKCFSRIFICFVHSPILDDPSLTPRVQWVGDGIVMKECVVLVINKMEGRL